MLQLQNETALNAAVFVFPDPDGVETLYAVVKGTFRLDQSGELTEEQVPIVLADEYWDDPQSSSLKYASEAHPSKLSTDVVMVGSAWAPNGIPVDQLDVVLKVAERTKVVRAFGDRTWKSGTLTVSPTATESFVRVPLVYEHAYGGPSPNKPVEGVPPFDDNPVGTGFLGGRKREQMNGSALPNLENPEQLIRSVSDQPTPTGFGFIPPHWPSRRQYAGSYDEEWQKTRAPFLPSDFDVRFFNSASPDLVFDRFLEGGESILIENASPKGSISASIPTCDFDVTVQDSDGRHALSPRLETVLIEPDESRVCLTWRTAFPCPGRLLTVERVDIESAEPSLLASRDETNE